LYLFFKKKKKKKDATSGNSNGKQQANESASRISLAKGIVGLITESQRALEIDKKFSLNNEDTESGLLERIQTVVELRGTLINTAVKFPNLYF